MDYIGEILSESELYMINIQINDVAQCGGETGQDIIINVGACQGEYLPTGLFIVYLAKLLNPLPKYIKKQDNNVVMRFELDWLINKDKHGMEVEPKHSDDKNFICIQNPRINQTYTCYS